MPQADRSIVIVPARGGSKRLPRKNVLELAGKPLIAHTIEAALACGCFGRVLVTTDDQEIRAVAEDYEGVSVDSRPPKLATDKIKVANVIDEICSRSDVAGRYDVVAMMLPTAPFRRIESIRRGFGRLTPEVDAVVSFAPYEFPPQMAVRLEKENGAMVPIFDPCPLITGNTRTQDQVPSYRPNGSFYMSWMASFRRYKSFFLGKVSGVEMTRLGSMDIDILEDLQLARIVAQAGLSDSDFV